MRAARRGCAFAQVPPESRDEHDAGQRRRGPHPCAHVAVTASLVSQSSVSCAEPCHATYVRCSWDTSTLARPYTCLSAFLEVIHRYMHCASDCTLRASLSRTKRKNKNIMHGRYLYIYIYIFLMNKSRIVTVFLFQPPSHLAVTLKTCRSRSQRNESYTRELTSGIC